MQSPLLIISPSETLIRRRSSVDIDVPKSLPLNAKLPSVSDSKSTSEMGSSDIPQNEEKEPQTTQNALKKVPSGQTDISKETDTDINKRPILKSTPSMKPEIKFVVEERVDFSETDKGGSDLDTGKEYTNGLFISFLRNIGALFCCKNQLEREK